MAHRQRNRGPHPEDPVHFHDDQVPLLTQAVRELSWLLSHGYARESASTFVGNHHGLHDRQRIAVWRSACSDQAREQRHSLCHPHQELRGRTLHIDGFNLITTIEAARSGGVILIGRDGYFRDMTSMHGSWRRVEQTAQAIQDIAGGLGALGVGHCHWFLDRPVSNSGRLAGMLREAALTHGLSWEVDCIDRVDTQLKHSQEIVITADAGILDQGVRSSNLTDYLLRPWLAELWTIDFAFLKSTECS